MRFGLFGGPSRGETDDVTDSAGGDDKPIAVGINVPNPEGASRDFLVCPYPQKSVFDKTKADVPGAVFEAANWSCQKPAA